MTGSARPGTVIALVVALALALNLLVYVQRVDNGVVRHDYWRFVELVDAFYEGQLDIGDMLGATNGPFKSLFVAGVIVLDGIWLDFELKTIHLLGALAMLPVAVLLYFFFRRDLAVAEPAAGLLFVPLVLLLLSPRLHFLLAHGQATLSVFRASLYVLSFAVFDWLLSGRRAGPTAQLAAAACVLLGVIGFGGMYFPAFVATITLVLLWKLIRARGEIDAGAALKMLVFIFLCVFLFGRTMSRGGGGVLSESLRWVMANPGEATAFLLSLVGRSFLRPHDASSSVVITVGVVLVVATVVATACFVSGRIRGPRVLPLALVVYPFVVMIMITLARGELGLAAANAKRYLADTPLFQVGVLWIFLCAAVRWRGRRKAIGIGSVAVVLGVVALAAVSEFRAQWEKAPFVKNYLERSRRAILAADELEDDELFRRLGTNRRQSEYVRDAIYIMRTRGLNVFRGESSTAAPGQPSRLTTESLVDLFENLDFERWSGDRLLRWSASGSYSRVADASSGRTAVRLEPRVDGDNRLVQPRDLRETAAGRRLRVEVSARSMEAAASRLRLELIIDGRWKSVDSASHPGDGRWRPLRTSYLLPADYPGGRVRLSLIHAQGAQRAADFDAVRVFLE